MIPAAIEEEEVEHGGIATATASKKTEAPKVETEARQKPSSTQYKSRSLAAGHWGDLESSQRSLRSVTQSEASATFLHGLLETPTDHPHHKRGDVLISVALHVLIVATVVAIPMLFTQTIDLHQFAVMYLTAPSVPAAPPPPPPAVAQARPAKPAQFRPGILTAPNVIPKRVEIVPETAAPSINSGGVVGGVPGGEAGGVLGGLIGGAGHIGTLAPPAPPAPARQIYRIGGQVKPPMLITQVQPEYPLIAKKAHVEGMVIIDAVIDENGSVIQARAVQGPALLFQAALQAVSQWKYQPTYLNGVPVPLELEVEVTFHLMSGD